MAAKQQISDNQLVKGCLKNDMDMQKALYFQLGPGIMAVCARYIKPIELAEEIFHDVILKIYDKIVKYNGSGSLAAWCRRLAVNSCLDYLRKTKNQVRINYIEEIATDVSDTLEDAAILDTVDISALENVIEQLPEQQQLVLNMFVLDDFSHKEIAASLHISENASRSLLLRAKKKIKSILGEKYQVTVNHGTKE